MYRANEEERIRLSKQSERETKGQLVAQNKLLKKQNREFREFQEHVTKPRPATVRNYAIKEDEPQEYDRSLINFFSSNNKDLQADLKSSAGLKSASKSKSKSRNVSKEDRPKTAIGPKAQKGNKR